MEKPAHFWSTKITTDNDEYVYTNFHVCHNFIPSYTSMHTEANSNKRCISIYISNFISTCQIFCQIESSLDVYTKLIV